MESVSRLGSLLENARDLTLEAAKDAGPRKTSRPLPAQQIKKLLDSRNERDVLDGLRRVVAMQYAQPPQPTLAFFPAVLKTMSNQTPSTRPLVYNYLVHHAEADPDTALLAINTIQKSLSDANPRIRSMSLKTMAGIRVPVISQIVSLAIKKGVSDQSPLVRKTAALACVKSIRLDASTRPQIEEYLATLLDDQQYYVVGAAVQAFMQICPDRIDMIHPIYRKLCKMIVDMDEWGQLATLRLMTIYGRNCFPRRTRQTRRVTTQDQKTADFYEDLDAKTTSADDFEDVEDIDPDLDLLLRSAQPLLHSRSTAVIIAVTKLYIYLSPTKHLASTIGPLIALLRADTETRELALYNIVQVCLQSPALFVPHIRHFFIRANESSRRQMLNQEILTLIFPHCSGDLQALVLTELEHFSQGQNQDLVRESVKAIGRCAQSSTSETSQKCLSLLLSQIHSADTHLVGEAVEVVRHMIQREPERHKKTIVRLAKNLDSLTSPTARASIIWLVGEFSGYDLEQNIAPDVLRILTKSYAEEKEEVQEQIILLAVKVYLHHVSSKKIKQDSLNALQAEDNKTVEQEPEEDNIDKLWQHVLLLAKYTSNFDLRDRTRMYRSLLLTSSNTELASLLLLAPKPIPQAPTPSEARKNFTFGSARLVIGDEAGLSYLKGYDDIPAWVADGSEPDPSLRRAVDFKSDSRTQVVSAGRMLDDALQADPGYKSEKPSTKTEKSLDAWLDESEEEESEDDEDTEEEESSEYESELDEDETDDEVDQSQTAKLVR